MKQEKESLLLKRISEKVGNPLEWSVVDKSVFCALIAMLATGVPLVHAIIAILRAKEPLTFINYPFAQTCLWIAAAVQGVLLLIILSGLLVRRRRPNSALFAHLTVQYITFTIVLVCYLMGPLTNPIVLISVTGALISLILFEWRVSLAGLATFFVSFTAVVMASSMGWIPYAPILSRSPVADGRIDPVFFVLMFSVVMPSLVFTIGVDAFIVFRWRRREEQVAGLAEFLKRMFGRYLSPEVMDTLIEDPGRFEMGGVKRKVTVVMTDLRGFTQLSERLDPADVVKMMNRYFEVMFEVCDDYGATVNDIIGDALLLTFGAPLEMEDHAASAAACAVEMQNAMARVNGENARDGLPDLEMGIGINTATVVMGNIGSEKRAKFSVMGSGVNMASRIESYTVGGQILVSSSVLKEATGALETAGEMEVQPKGAEAPMKVYEVIGVGGRYNQRLERLVERLTAPLAETRIAYSVVEGKHVTGGARETPVLRLSRSEAEIEAAAEITERANLKLNLPDAPDGLDRLDFYAKVVSLDGVRARVRFVSPPPEIASYLETLTCPGER